MAKKLGKTDDESTVAGNVTQTVFVDFYKDYSGALAKLETAQAEVRNILKRAKAGGIDTAMLKRARTEQRMDPEALKAQIRALDSYRRFMGLPTGSQGALAFDEDDVVTDPEADETDSVTIEDAAVRGLASGKRGDARDSNPFRAGSQQFASFDKNWNAGKRLSDNGLGEGPKHLRGKRGAKITEVPTSELLPKVEAKGNASADEVRAEA